MQQHNTLDIDVDVSLYVENRSGMIFECQFFEDYVLLRPATPELFNVIIKATLQELVMNYSDFCGNRNEVLEHMATGRPMEFMQETRH